MCLRVASSCRFAMVLRLGLRASLTLYCRVRREAIASHRRVRAAASPNGGGGPRVDGLTVAGAPPPLAAVASAHAAGAAGDDVEPEPPRGT